MYITHRKVAPRLQDISFCDGDELVIQMLCTDEMRFYMKTSTDFVDVITAANRRYTYTFAQLRALKAEFHVMKEYL